MSILNFLIISKGFCLVANVTIEFAHGPYFWVNLPRTRFTALKCHGPACRNVAVRCWGGCEPPGTQGQGPPGPHKSTQKMARIPDDSARSFSLGIGSNLFAGKSWTWSTSDSFSLNIWSLFRYWRRPRPGGREHILGTQKDSHRVRILDVYTLLPVEMGKKGRNFQLLPKGKHRGEKTQKN